MEKLQVPQKLIRLVKMTMLNSRARVITENGPDEEFEINAGVRQGDGLSAVLFNIADEGITREYNGESEQNNAELRRESASDVDIDAFESIQEIPAKKLTVKKKISELMEEEYAKNVRLEGKQYYKQQSSTNLVGKFTQSVRRIVQDVKDEGTATGATKEEVIETNERLRAVRVRMDESYDTAKKALVGLMGKYNESKSVHNIFQRYNMLKAMIKEVIRLETQYWTLVDIPKQEKQETVPAFVLRACAIMEKTQKSGEGVKTSAKLAEEAQDKRERIERLENMTTSQIDAENTQMTNDLYRLLKKYSGLRNLIRQLKTEYTNAKLYPMVLRYSMLKDMIKDIMLHPDYMEVCHEVDA
ncbi:uncharacterized protein LOC130448996 [Diorhabda sublineata]|uniref:uncharacterized protein LOC130448996 n=1 Tax=Diorhabda sublineata TaxID=1163346 RepID=UPI0024E12650|nr:uncharacterized protein LOC130448996 [Diorhabda sublineata]